MSAKQRGSKIEQYADKEFAGDELYSNTDRDDPAMQASRERRKQGNREWKGAVRDSKSRDPRIQALGVKTARDMMNAGHQPQTGIPGQGEYDRQDRESADNHITVGKRASDSINGRENPSEVIAGQVAANKSPASPQVPVPGGAAAPAGVAGVAPPTTDENGPVSAPTPSTGQGATSPVTTPPVAQGDAGNGKPAVPEWQQKRTDALDALKGKFTKQDAANALAEKAAPQAIDPKYQATKEEMAEPQTDSRIPTRSAKEPTPEEAKAASSTAAFGKAYGDYLNGAGKTASKEEKDAKYAELKTKAVKDGFVVTQEGKDRAAPAIEKARQAEIAQKKEILDIISGKKSEVAELMEDVAKARGYKDHLSMRQDEVFGENVRNDIVNNEKFKSIPSEYPKTNDTSQSFVDNGQQIPFASDYRQMINLSLSNDSNYLTGFKSDGPPALAAGSPATPKGAKTGGAEDSTSAAKNGWLDAAGSDLGSAGDFAKNYFMGGRELVNKVGKFSSGAMSNIGSLATNVAQNLVPGELGRKIREADPASKVKNTIYDATQFLPNKVLESDKTRSPDQASIDNKLQQREAAYRAPVDDVLERSNFLQRYAV